MTIPELASRNTTPILWVDLNAAITHVIPTVGRAGGSLLLYGCTLEHNTMQGYMINAVKDATNWVTAYRPIILRKSGLPSQKVVWDRDGSAKLLRSK